MLSSFKLALYLCFQGAVKAVGVYLLILEELTRSDALAKLLGGEEEIFHSMLLGTARSTTCCRDREGKAQALLHQVVDDCRLARSRGGRENDEFASHGVLVEG